MSFTPFLTDQLISYATNNACYRNLPREQAWGSPVFFCPDDTPVDQYGLYAGPRYAYGYNYNDTNSPNYAINGNCTWLCWCRLYDALGVRLPGLGDAKNWYANYSGDKDPDASSANAGDIIVFTDSDAGHVMFIEQVDNDGTLHISHSAYSTRACWNGYTCRTGTYNKSEIYQGAMINMYKDCDPSNPYNVEVVGVIHTGEASAGLDPVIVSIVGNIVRDKKGININVKIFH